MLEGKTKFTIKNISEGKMLLASVALENGDTIEVNPIILTDETKREIEYFIATGQIEVSIVDVVESKETNKKVSDVVNKETTKNENGETHKHVVYDPETARKNRAIEVTTLEKSKAIEVEDSKLDLIDFLNKHWKTIEKELEKITDIEKLEKLLTIAIEQGIKKGNKKYELIQERISKL